MNDKLGIHFRAFIGNGARPARGNPCEVRLTPPPEIPPAAAAGTLCYSWPASQHRQFHVQCFAAGQSIQCCGHGLLSAARHWLDSDNAATVTLRMSDSSITARKDKLLIWLRFPRLPCHQSDIPARLNKFFSAGRPVNVATAGGEDGYLVLQWPDDYPLEWITAPDREIAQFTRRAIICTARAKNPATPEIHFRYFAPQYGVQEDQATGSALRVLTDYWAADATMFRARQCSREGGLFWARAIDRQFVEIAGLCERVDPGADSGKYR